MIHDYTRGWLPIAAMVWLASLTSCSHSRREWRVAISPDGTSRAVLEEHWRPLSLDPGVRLSIYHNGRVDRFSTYEGTPSTGLDSFAAPFFAELAWSADGRYVFAFMRPSPTMAVRWHYDTQSRRLLSAPPDEAIRAAILANYREELSDQAAPDPIRWSSTDEAYRAFSRRLYGIPIDPGLPVPTDYPKPYTTRYPAR
jgi:hypothetical protein